MPMPDLSFAWSILVFILDKLGRFKPPEDRPEVILDRLERDKIKQDDYFIVKNIGNKTALNVQLSSMNLNIKDFFKLYFKFTKLDNLDPKKEHRIDCDVYVIEDDGRQILSDAAKKLFFIPHIHTKYADQDFDFLFSYNDSSNRLFVTHFSIGKSGIVTKGVYYMRNPKFIEKKFKNIKKEQKRGDVTSKLH